MPQIASHHRNARFCPILGISQQVKQLKARGVELVDLSVGVPNFKPAAHVYDKAATAVAKDTGTYGSSRGDTELITAYLQYLEGEGINGYAEHNVVIGLGAKHLLHSTINTIVEKGDEVLVPTPCWPTYFDIIEQAGGTVVPVKCSVDKGYKLDAEALQRALTPKTRAIILNNPCNPTGASYSRQELSKLAAPLLERDIWVISDDVYSRFVAPEVDFCHILHVAPALRDRVVKIDSISKMYGMPGWRVGMLAAPVALAEALVSFNSNSISNIPQVAAAAAVAALQGDQGFSLRMVDAYLAKRDIVFETLAGSTLIKCPKPAGAFYMFPDISACFGLRLGDVVVRNDLDLARLLLEEARVAVVPGSYFGEANSFRISYSYDNASLAAGAERIKRLLDHLA